MKRTRNHKGICDERTRITAPVKLTYLKSKVLKLNAKEQVTHKHTHTHIKQQQQQVKYHQLCEGGKIF